MFSMRYILGLCLLWPASHLVAAPIVLDLNTGSFVTLFATRGQTRDYTGVYQSPSFDIDDVVIAGGETATFDILFNDGEQKQYIRVADFGGTRPNEGVIFDVQGTGTAKVNPVVNLSGATGSYRVDSTTNADVVNELVLSYSGVSDNFLNGIRIGAFNTNFPNDPARFSDYSLDVTQSALQFTDLHLAIFNQGPGPITLTALSFQAIGNTVEIGAVPVPAAAWLLGSALLGLGALARRQS